MHSSTQPRSLLYHLLHGMPPLIQREAFAVTGTTLGLEAQPTGLKPTAKRTPQHLYWDISLDEIFERYDHLVESVE